MNTNNALRNLQRISLGRVLFAMFLLGAAVFLGLIAAVFSLGSMLRLSVLALCCLLLVVISIPPRTAYNGSEGKIGLFLLVTLIMSVILWPGYFYLHVGSSPNINAPNLLALAMLFVSIGFFLRRSEIRQIARIGFSETRVFSLLLLSWYAWRLLAAAMGSAPLPSIFDILKQLGFVSGAYLGLLCFIDSREKRNYLLLAILIAGLASALFGLVEFAMKQNPLSHFISVARDTDQSLALTRALSERYRAGAYRIQATSDHPISAGQFFSMLFFVGIYAVHSQAKLFRYVGLVVISLSIVVIFLTGSRSAYIAVTIGMMFLLPILVLTLFRAGNRSLHYLVFAVFGSIFVLGIFLVAAITFPGLLDQLLSSDKGSSTARLDMLTRGIPAIMDSPLVGYGHSMAAFKAGLSGSDGYLTIDNYFLSMALDYGLPALIIYALMFTTTFLYAFKTPTKENSLDTSMGLLAPVLVCYLTIQAVASLESNQIIAIALCYLIVRSVSLGRLSSPQSTQPTRPVFANKFIERHT